MEDLSRLVQAAERVSRALSELEMARRERDDAIVYALDTQGVGITRVSNAAGMSATGVNKAANARRLTAGQFPGQTSIDVGTARAAIDAAPQRPRKRGAGGRRA